MAFPPAIFPAQASGRRGRPSRARLTAASDGRYASCLVVVHPNRGGRHGHAAPSRCPSAPARLACGRAGQEGSRPGAGAWRIDISGSIDPDEAKLQREGYVKAFRDPVIIKAILGGANGRIAVAYYEWSDAWVQKLLIDWTLLD